MLLTRKSLAWTGVAVMALTVAAGAIVDEPPGPLLLGIRVEFFLFALTLLGVALFHDRTLDVGVIGLASIVLLKYLTVTDFSLARHAWEEAPILINLLGLLLGFAVLARHFEQSDIPEILPRFLPDDWKSGFTLLAMVFVLSAFLDNLTAILLPSSVISNEFHLPAV